MKIIVPFIELIYNNELSQHKKNNQKYREKAIKIKNETYVDTKWHCDTFNTLDSNFNLLNDSLFENLITDTIKEVKKFSTHFGINENCSVICPTAWINVSEFGNYQEFHLHPKSHFSAVYYVKVPQNSGNIIFRSHRAMNDMFNLPIKKGTQASFDSFTVTPVEGELIIFRSNLWHMVEKNYSNENRICVSMNFEIV